MIQAREGKGREGKEREGKERERTRDDDTKSGGVEWQGRRGSVPDAAAIFTMV